MKDIISITMGELTTAVDNEVMKAVQKVGIDVNKEELLKALELHNNLVRCRECKYWNEGKCWNLKGLNKTDGIVNANDYCSYGERSE